MCTYGAIKMKVECILLILSLLGSVPAFAQLQLVEGQRGVCGGTKSFIMSTLKNRVVQGRVVTDVAYVTQYVSDLKCCNGYEQSTVGGSSCQPRCTPRCVNGICEAPFSCRCNPGWYGRDCSKDINECWRFGICGRARCINTPGSYRCGCSGGFQLDDSGLGCSDVDECTLGIHNCSHNCVNTVGYYKCDCPTGYILKDIKRKNCKDVDECLLDNGGCDHLCQNTLGSRVCSCYPGFNLQSDSRSCKGSDPCDSGVNNCTQVCNNVDGGFYCSCNPGFVLNDDYASCSDVNECLERFTGCEQLCNNTDGSYQCGCREGYILNRDGKTCDGVDYCSSNNGGCDQICNNTDGGYQCGCRHGYILNLDGQSCQEIFCDELSIPDSGVSQCSGNSSNIGTVCSFSCDSGFQISSNDSVVRECTSDGTWNGTEALCNPLTCPDLYIDQLSVLQPCEQEFTETCTFLCNRGYYFDAAGNRTKQMTCSLDARMQSVEWSSEPTCQKLAACDQPTPPCLHGGICSSMGLEDFLCNCSGTGYIGKKCQIGVIIVPDIPPLNVSVPFVLTIKAKPTNSLKIQPRVDRRSGIQFVPRQAELSSGVHSVDITITPKSVGIFPLSFSLLGSSRNEFMTPDDIVVVVMDPSTRPPDDYFEEHGLAPGILQPGCCKARTQICNSNVDIVSTCSWDSNQITPGIVFTNNSNFFLPLSVGGAKIVTNSNPLQIDFERATQDCATCSGCSFSPYDIVPNDILNFYDKEALAKTYMSNIAHTLPKWMKIVANVSTRAHSYTSHVTRLSSSLNDPICTKFPFAMFNNIEPQFSILMYYGITTLTIDSDSISITGKDNPLCIAMDACSGVDSPTFVSFPSKLTDEVNFLQDYSNRGWKFVVDGMAVSRQIKLNSSFEILIKGILEMSNKASIDGLTLNCRIEGSGGFAVSQLDKVFDNGLAENVNGEINGQLQITLKLDDDTPIYSLQRKEGKSTFSIGGPMQLQTCGRETLQGTVGDNLFTRESSILTSFLEIPPDLRHGDRYQFDCNLTYSIYTGPSATMNGVKLKTSCHQLRINRLLIPDVVQTLHFGQQKQPSCLPLDIPETMTDYPVIGVAQGTMYTELGHLMSQSQPNIIYGMNLQSQEYTTIFRDVNVMIYEDMMFLANITVSSTDQSLSFSSLNTVGGYQFHTLVTGDSNQEWEDLVLNVQGVATTGPDSLMEDLQNRTLQILKSVADNAIERLAAAEETLKNMNETNSNLIADKNAANMSLRALTMELSSYDNQIRNTTAEVSILQRQLDSIGINITLFRQRANNGCTIERCIHACVPGLINTTCTTYGTVDIWGTCQEIDFVWVDKNIFVDRYRIACESWQNALLQARTCGCAATFGNCFCEVNNAIGRWCIGGQYFCYIDTYKRVRVQEPTTVTVPCVVGSQNVTNTTICEIGSDCAKTVVDLPCELANNACYAMRNNLVMELNRTESAAAQILSRIQQKDRMLIALNITRRSKQAKLTSARKKLRKLIDDCNRLAASSQVIDIDRIRQINKAGIELSKTLHTSTAFNILNISFATSVSKESIRVVNLQVIFRLPSKGVLQSTFIPFDFSNPSLSLARASRRLSQLTISSITSTSARAKRQTLVEPFESIELQMHNTQLMNLFRFYQMLFEELQSLNTTANDISNTAEDLADFYKLDVDNPFPIDTSSSPELSAVLNLQESLAIASLETAAAETQNLFPLWQSKISVFLNESGGLLDQECSGLSDCFASSVDVLDTIISSAPDHISVVILPLLRKAEKKLMVLSINPNLTLSEAISRIKSMLDVLQMAIDTEYWSTELPNIYETSPYNISILANEELVLKCLANYSKKFPVRFHWKKDGLLLPMVNKELLVIRNVSLSNMGNYTCLVGNHAGTVESSWSYVTVIYPPKFYLEPSNQTVIVGDGKPAKLQCNCTSVPNPQFRWYYKPKFGTNFSQMVGVVGNEYHINNPQPHHEGWYRCEAWVRFDNRTDASTFSRPAFVSVVDYSISTLSIPIKIEIDTSSKLNEQLLKIHIESLNEKILLNSEPNVRPEVSGVQVKQINELNAVISISLDSRNASIENLDRTQLPLIVNEISACRNELFNVRDAVKTELSSIGKYAENKLELVQSASDVSDYSFAFKCPPGQRTDDSFILCTNCPPGTYQANTTKTMADDSGLEFTVDQQNCLPCPHGTYRPDQGSTQCVDCLSGISHVEGAITSEHCVAIVAFERPALEFSEAMGYLDICIRTVSERLDDITVVVHSCKLEPDTNQQFDSIMEDFTRTVVLGPQNSRTCLPLNITNDDACERDKKLRLCLTPISMNTILGNLAQTTITIEDDDCVCPYGYQLAHDGLVCIDIDECANSTDNCTNGCVNTEGSYYCTCPAGYELSGDNTTCIEIDECFKDTDNCTHMCVNTEGSYYCTCPSGYELKSDNNTCVDIDECAKGIDNCTDGCINIDGLYYCTCFDGYELNGDNMTCFDIDECSDGTDDCTGGCVNIEGSYNCTCSAGYELKDDNITCVDIDECTKGTDNCTDECVNTEGSYYCASTCPDGYELQGDNTTCVDVNECTQDINNCTVYCINTEGSYYCTCPSGYELGDDSYKCVDIDECTKGTDSCSDECENTEGSYYCTCHGGYELTSDNSTCVDIDECTKDMNICTLGCVNTEGSYYCTCPGGYELIGDNSTCVDTDECTDGTDNCTHGCVNTKGSYYCTCPGGYELSGDNRTCVDTDECMDGTDNCTHGCVNTDGSYYCTCPGGYELKGDNKTCVDIDECTEDTDDCSVGCVNTEGSYYCTCPGGYELSGDNRTCVDIDECTKSSGNCTDGCVNTEGSYYCTCPVGYELIGDNSTCVDTDECTDGTDNCTHGCVNTDGSYYCTCPGGYQLSADNKTCVDIDECTEGTDNCTHGCVNTAGSYYCTCSGGYELKSDNSTCVDIDECTKDTHDCSDGCVNTEGSYYCTCPVGYGLKSDNNTCVDIDKCINDMNNNCTNGCINNEGSYYCTCPDGYKLNGDKRTCVDIDECTMANDMNNCTHGCINTEGFYFCTCPDGYKLREDNNTCSDIDECTKGTEDCTDGCVNTEGSYYCTCPGGYELEDDNATCVDIDECTKGTDKCTHGCINNEGSYYCTCPARYELLKGDNNTCVDIDECTMVTHNCTDGCVNTVGSYYCTCPDRYELKDDNNTCVDINECTKGTAKCTHGCVNSEGSYYCTCPNGYELKDDNNTCVDIDECARGTDECSDGCANAEGSYYCTCDGGYELSGDNKTCVATCNPMCQNGGTCSDRNVCTCPIGWSGVVCEIDIRSQRDYYLAYFKNWLLSASLNDAVMVAYSEGPGLVTIKTGSRIRKKSLSPGLPIIFQITEAVTYYRSYKITVQAGSPVELFGGSFNQASAGAFKLFPPEGVYFQSTHNAVYRYFAVSAPPDLPRVNSVVSIVSTADDATVTIKLTADATVYRPYTKGSTVTISARKEQPIPIISANGDLTGTEVVSNKPLAVYSGHECATIPTKKQYCDQIVEQIPPVSSLGTKYIASPFARRQGGAVVKIVATNNQTAVTIKCDVSISNVLLKISQSYLFTTPPNKACYIAASQPILVAQLSTGKGDELFGDPSMVILPPIEGFSNSSIVYSFGNDRAIRNYISLITPETAVKDACITVDGLGMLKTDVISVAINGSSSFNVVRISVSPGIHKVTSSCGDVGVLAYGFGPSTAYAYSNFVQASPINI